MKIKNFFLFTVLLMMIFMLYCADDSSNVSKKNALANNTEMVFFQMEYINHNNDSFSKKLLENLEKRMKNAIYVLDKEDGVLKIAKEKIEEYQKKNKDKKPFSIHKFNSIKVDETKLKRIENNKSLRKIKVTYNKPNKENISNMNIEIFLYENPKWRRIVNGGNFRLPYNYKTDKEDENKKQKLLDRMINIITVMTFK